MLGRGIAALLLLSLAAACSRHADAPAAEAARKTPSGQPVPRYVSLKFDKVNARAGPADDSRLLWIYHARGLPLQVVAETDEWRRVCDPSGAVAWAAGAKCPWATPRVGRRRPCSGARATPSSAGDGPVPRDHRRLRSAAC
jgi:hypothetical protein